MSKTIRKEYKGEGKRPNMFNSKKSRHESREVLATLKRK